MSNMVDVAREAGAQDSQLSCYNLHYLEALQKHAASFSELDDEDRTAYVSGFNSKSGADLCTVKAEVNRDGSIIFEMKKGVVQ
jgi:hypothetical protein